MVVFTEPQRTLILWLFKRRNTARFADMVIGLIGDKPKRTDQLAKTLDSLRPDFIEEAGVDTADSPTDAKIMWNLTDRAREIAANVKSALQDAEAETVQTKRR